MIQTSWLIAACCASAVVAALVAHIATRRRDINKVAYMMDAMEDGELNFRFLNNNRLNRTLNRIRFIFDKQRTAHEQDSWNKLIRILTHEIMNTVTPIYTLSDALANSVDDEGRSQLNIKAGLKTIAHSSNNLIRFVESYRQMSGLARPIKRPLTFNELMDKIIALNSELVAEQHAQCRYLPMDSDLIIYADEGQIAQILINLIKNALQAGAKHIEITSMLADEDEIVVEVANDGEPIPIAAQESIFVPFFSTKSEGSGIGLSISQQIMHQHNGSIELLRSNQSQTVFRLTFR